MASFEDERDLESKERPEDAVIPVVAEEIHAGFHKVKTGSVRVQKRVKEHEEIIDQPLQREQVEVRRVIKNEVVDGPLPVRQAGDTTIIPVVKEVLRVEKQWRLVEEYHLVKRHVEERDQQRVVLRHEDAEVERLDADGVSRGPAQVHSVRAAPQAQAVPGQPVTPKKIVEPEPFTERLRARRLKPVRENKIIK